MNNPSLTELELKIQAAFLVAQKLKDCHEKDLLLEILNGKLSNLELEVIKDDYAVVLDKTYYESPDLD